MSEWAAAVRRRLATVALLLLLTACHANGPVANTRVCTDVPTNSPVASVCE